MSMRMYIDFIILLIIKIIYIQRLIYYLLFYVRNLNNFIAKN